MTAVPMRVFTFWEPRDSIVPYLSLCLHSWECLGPDYEVVMLDYSNLHEWIEPDVLDDLQALKSLRLASQKNVIQIAVLAQHGGIFLDVDTICLGPPTAMVAALQDAELVMYRRHLGAVAARPKSSLLTSWLSRNLETLGALDPDDPDNAGKRWDLVGNRTLELALDDQASTAPLGSMLSLEAVERSEARSPKRGRVQRMARRARQELVFRTMMSDRFQSLGRDPFMPELSAVGNAKGSHREKYVTYWFSETYDLETVMRPQTSLIGLHNSWTPPWYAALSAPEVLEHPCLLSQTLRHVAGVTG